MQALDKYGMNQLRQGDYAMAARIFEQMLATPGLSQGARLNTLFRISVAYASIKDLDAARRALKEALRIVPDEPQLLARLALVEAADGHPEVSVKLLSKAIEGLSGNPELLAETRLQLAAIYAQLDQWENSVEQYLFVLDIDPVDKETSRQARMGLSNAYVQGGDMEKGEKVLEEVYEEDPSDPGVNNDLGYLYADQGKNLEQAEKMIRIAVAAQPENPAYLDSLGWVLFKLGKNEEALEALQKANSDPDYQDATLLEHEGDVHQALQKMDEAKTLWRQAVEVEQKSKRPDPAVLKRLGDKLGENIEPKEPAEPAKPGQQ
jgi:Tfp pilus assembly protein PilF